MGKKRKREQNGETNLPRDQMPLEGSSDISPSSCDVLIQLKDIIQVKVNTDERLQKLEEKVEKIKNKSREDLSVLKQVHKKEIIDEIKEDLKKELIDEVKEGLKKELIDEVKEDLKKQLIDEVKEELKLEIQEEMQKLETKSKEDFSVFKEDLKKELKEVKEEPDLDIQEEMQKEGCAKVHHCNASPSLRSQSHQSLTTRFRLVINSAVSSTVYKGKTIQTDDNEGHIEVVLYDGGSLIAPDHHLASVTVQLVVVKAEISELTQGFWSKDDFKKYIIEPRQGVPRLVKDGKFMLAGGRYRHKGAVIMDNSNRKDVKLGVMIVGDTEERVLEGISNPFRVQEAKTEINRGKRKESTTDDTAEDLQRYTGQSFSYVTEKNRKIEDSQTQWLALDSGTQRSSPQATMQNSLQLATTQIEGNGQARNRNVQQYVQQFAMRTSTQAVQQGQDHQHNLPQPMLQNPSQRICAHIAGQGQQYSLPPTGQMRNFPNMLNPSQRAYAQTAGNGQVGPLPLDCLQQQYSTQQGITQQGNRGQGRQHSFPPTGHNFPITQNPSQTTYAQTASNRNGPDSQLPIDQLQQQNNTQLGTTQLENHGQGQQNSFPPIEHNFPITQNPSQRPFAQTSGNGPNNQLLVDHLQQQNTTRQGTTQLENHGQGRQHSFPPTEHNFPITQNPSQITNAQTTGNYLDGQLPADHLQQQYTTQHATTQLENHGHWQHSFPPTGQMRNFPIMQDTSQRTYAQTTGNGPDGQLPVDHLQQQYTTQHATIQLENHGNGQVGPLPIDRLQQQYTTQQGNGQVGPLPIDRLQQQYTTQQGTTQLRNHGQGQQNNFPPTEHNFPITQNLLRTTYAQAAGNGPDGQLPVDHLHQQNTTEQGTTQLENHAQGRQHCVQPTGQVCNFPITQNPSQRIYAQRAGNGQDSPLPVDQLQQQNTTQQGTTQLENHGSDLFLDLAVFTPSSSLLNNCHETSASTIQINPAHTASVFSGPEHGCV